MSSETRLIVGEYEIINLEDDTVLILRLGEGMQIEAEKLTNALDQLFEENF